MSNTTGTQRTAILYILQYLQLLAFVIRGSLSGKRGVHQQLSNQTSVFLSLCTRLLVNRCIAFVSHTQEVQTRHDTTYDRRAFARRVRAILADILGLFC